MTPLSVTTSRRGQAYPVIEGVEGSADSVPRTGARDLALAARQALAEVLIGRDRAPVWRSAATRRTAVALGWVGWAALTAPALAATELDRRGNGIVPHGPGALGWLAVGFAVAAAVPLAPRYALLAWRIAYLGVLLTPLIPGQTRADAGYYVVLAIVYAVAGFRYGRPVLWWMAALTLIPVWLWTGPDWVYPAEVTGLFVAGAAALDVAGNWRRDRGKLAAQTERAEREREHRAVLEERARIAREMHDVVAHHMSMIAVQAETAPYRLAARADGTALPEPVREEFAALSGAAREALTEMRGLLAVLRSDHDHHHGEHDRHGEPDHYGAPRDHHGGDPAELAPQPQLTDLPTLIDGARRAGANVCLTMPETESPLPRGVGLTAYRIVQESLSNAGRHAPGAAISVVVQQSPQSVRIKIKNEPPAASPLPADGTGHGLAGMRERVALLGGSLEAGPEADGGFAVRAVLPAGNAR
jgi:signal transduction histidine kinase